eukprot:1116937-Prymnesium_polylepis.1
MPMARVPVSLVRVYARCDSPQSLCGAARCPRPMRLLQHAQDTTASSFWLEKWRQKVPKLRDTPALRNLTSHQAVALFVYAAESFQLFF